MQKKNETNRKTLVIINGNDVKQESAVELFRRAERQTVLSHGRIIFSKEAKTQCHFRPWNITIIKQLYSTFIISKLCFEKIFVYIYAT